MSSCNLDLRILLRCAARLFRTLSSYSSCVSSSPLWSSTNESSAPTPYRDDDDFDGYPASFGPHSVKGADDSFVEDQRGDEETQEEYEDRVLNKRAAHLNNILKSKLHDDMQSLTFEAMTRRNNRKQVAQKFYSLLVLQKVMAVELNQNKCYGEVTVARGPKFESAML
jgi:hypothetical protein